MIYTNLTMSDHLWILGNIILFVCVRAYLIDRLSGYSWGFSVINIIFILLAVYMLRKSNNINY